MLKFSYMTYVAIKSTNIVMVQTSEIMLAHFQL